MNARHAEAGKEEKQTRECDERCHEQNVSRPPRRRLNELVVATASGERRVVVRAAWAAPL
jgi:hypothetical protein